MNTLGDSARIKIAPQTLAEAQKPLDRAKKNELRREQIMAFIRRRPLGSRITDDELRIAGNFKNSPIARQFVLRMVRDGFITRENLTPRTYTYTVLENEKVRITKQADPMRRKFTLPEFKEMAVQWSWNHQHQHNDLHAFIESVMNKETTNANTKEYTDTRRTSTNGGAEGQGTDTTSTVPDGEPN